MNRPRAEFLAGTETTEFMVNGRKVASRAPRVPAIFQIARGSNGAVAVTKGPSRNTRTTSTPPASASADASSIGARHSWP